VFQLTEQRLDLRDPFRHELPPTKLHVAFSVREQCSQWRIQRRRLQLRLLLVLRHHLRLLLLLLLLLLQVRHFSVLPLPGRSSSSNRRVRLHARAVHSRPGMRTRTETG
jgi:hypothetical protein